MILEIYRSVSECLPSLHSSVSLLTPYRLQTFPSCHGRRRYASSSSKPGQAAPRCAPSTEADLKGPNTTRCALLLHYYCSKVMQRLYNRAVRAV